jgi:hypothetical protein
MEKKWYLGKIKGTDERVFLEDFKWDCGWYWAGGCIGNRNFHAHFDGAFLEQPDPRGHCLGPFFDPWTKPPEYTKTHYTISNGASVWEPLEFFLDDAQYPGREWWKIKDLYKQFYAYRAAAECFRYGGHCCGNVSEAEKNPWMAAVVNKHIETVIIPEVHKALNKD